MSAKMGNHEQTPTLNPYIALSDLAMNLVFILVFFFAAANAVGRAGWEQVRYRDAQKEFRQQIRNELPIDSKPREHVGKNDPPGVQRWVYPRRSLFKNNTAEVLPDGKRSLILFARLLKRNQGLWKRVRVEGHTMPPSWDQPDNWALSSARAASVARILNIHGHIPSYYLAVSGRAGQSPLNKAEPGDPANERVEILIEYAQKGTLKAQSSAGVRR